LVEAASEQGLELTLLSDHGSGGSSDKVLYLNRALEEAGLLRFRSGPGATLATAAKAMALTGLPPRLRERLFKLGGSVLPSWLESQARFGAIDFGHTKAFSDELNYFPAIHLNLEAREPEGVVGGHEHEAVIREVRATLMALRDPWSGKPVVKQVWRREELFEGPEVKHAPDLLLDLHLDAVNGGHYSYNLQPSASAPPATGPWRRLSDDEYLGRKGRSLPGSHRSHGFFLAHGPSIAPVGRIDAHIADVTATLLARMGVHVPAEASGRVLWEVLADTVKPEHDLPKVALRSSGGGNQAAVERRLRALGYVD
jgi:predicted AlkP superfamily phosphohydrolase/phosphomutase